MRLSSRNPVHRLREILVVRDLDKLSDAELLARYSATRDEDAFTTLVRRHTPLVLGTARRVLHNSADADDVLQAAFLTLSRKAASLRCDGTLVGWLHRVTYRLALRARKRPLESSRHTPCAVGEDPLDRISGRELCSAIDEELARLSEGLRAAIVLCCFQGLTRDEAAAELGWSTATLKRRLARARAILERRLSARGITLAAALAPAVMSATLSVSACTKAIVATVETVLGRSDLSARVGALCTGSVGMATSRYVMIAASGLIAVSLVVGFQLPTPSGPMATLPVSTPKKEERQLVDAQGDPLPPGAVARIGTTRFRHDEWINHAVWSPDGKSIASAAGRTVIVWEAETGREVHRQTLKEADFPDPKAKERYWPSSIQSLDWSPDGKAFLTMLNGSLQRWAWDSEKKSLRMEQAGVEGARHPVVSSRFAGGSSWILFATSRTVSMANLDTKTLGGGMGFKTRMGADDSDADITGADVSPDGKFAVVTVAGKRNMLFVCDLLGLNSPELKTRFDRLVGVSGFSADGKTYAAITVDSEKNLSVEVWDATTWKSRLRFPYPKPGDQPAEIRSLALSPDGKTLVTAGDNMLRWWDTTTGKETRKSGPSWPNFNRATFRPDGKVLMTASFENHIRLRDVESGKELPLTSGPGWAMAAAAWTPDGKRVLTVSEHSVYAHDAATGRELWRGSEHTDTAVQVVVTPDGKTAISSGNDGRVIFRELETGKVIRTIDNPRHSVDTIALSVDGRTLTALGIEPPHDGALLSWDVQSGKAYEAASLPKKGALYGARALLPTPDGTGIAISSGTELRVPVFSRNGKELLAEYGPTDGGISYAAYSPDGWSIAAASLASTIFLWETATGQPRLILKDAGYTTCLAFSPDGRILAVANNGSHRMRRGDKTVEFIQDRLVVRLLDSFTGIEFHRLSGHTGSIQRLAWSTDGRRLMSGSQDASCLIWDVTPEVRAKMPSKAMDETATNKELGLLGSAKSTDAYAAMARLTGSPTTTVRVLRTVLKPVVAPDAGKVAALIRDLDSPQFAVRDKAAGQLLRMGEGVEGLLKKALAGKNSTEVRDRIEKLLGDLKPSSERVRQGRSLEILQRIGDPEAKRLLTEISSGAEGAWLTREAKSALERVYPGS